MCTAVVVGQIVGLGNVVVFLEMVYVLVARAIEGVDVLVIVADRQNGQLVFFSPLPTRKRRNKPVVFFTDVLVFIYSTTGSLDSVFADMTAAHCAQYETLFRAYPNHTFLFEITDTKDVHIIREELGETLIGCIDVATGRQFSEAELDEIGKQYGIRRPETLKNITFGELKGRLKNVEHEGFMVFDAQNGEMLFKLKSPYYLISKFLGRSNEGNIGRKLDKRHVDEEFYPLIDHIRDHREAFNAMPELDKIAFIQAFLRQL